MSNLFSLLNTDSNCLARAGILHTSHGEIETPVFMPVGTQGTVKAISQKQLKDLNAKIILGNTYHLYLRPGNELFSHFGGLHKFINWNGAMLTDSGGYQVFSLKELRKITEEGVSFSSHLDGSKHVFTPENVIDTQRILGSDFVMVLDECTPFPSEYQIAKTSMELSLRWAARAKAQFENSIPLYGNKQFLFGIGQGSMYADLRKIYIKEMIEIGFDGYAIGGLSVGEPAEIMYEMVSVCTDLLPIEQPRYLMGVGTPENILEGIERGIDMFDCVLPTRNARNGQLFTSRGKINIKNNQYKDSKDLIDENVNCFASQNYTLGYLRHLFMSNEILGAMIATENNIAFYLQMMLQARNAILNNNYTEWKNEFLFKLK